MTLSNPSTFQDFLILMLLNRLAAGKAPIGEALKNGQSPREIAEKIRIQNWLGLAKALKALEKDFEPEREFDECARLGISLLFLGQPDYPALLREIPDPPLLMYVKGRLLRGDDAAALAIVGSRHATEYGLYHARKFAREISAHGFTVVSGLARGIDQAAHEGALETGGRTLAVLGCGADQVYPAESRRLFDRIADQGALISEYALGAKPLAHHFPRRNRIISGLSLGVLVIEAHLQSGSLITAREALDQGREVFAMPGRIDQLTSQGTHEMLRQGACLADSSWTLVECLGREAQRRLNCIQPHEAALPDSTSAPERLPRADRENSDADAQAVNPEAPIRQDLSFLGDQAWSCEELQKKTGRSLQDLFSWLLRMELTGALRKTPDGRYSVNVR